MIGYKHNETVGGGKSSYMHLQMASQRHQHRDTSPSNNGTNELVTNLDHELLDVRVRAVKCLLRKVECGIVSLDSLKDRVDLLDRCRRWLADVLERQGVTENGSKECRLEGGELEGVELVIQLLCTLGKHKDFRDLLRKHNFDRLLSKFEQYLVGDYYKSQLAALLNSIAVGQYELSYEGSPSEWFDNKTCPIPSSRQLEMFGSLNKQYSSYKPYGEDTRSSPGRTEFDSNRNTPAPEPAFSKTANIPLVNESGWIRNIQFFVPSVHLSGTDKRVIHSTVDSLSATNDSLVLMTVSFIRDTLVMDYPSELFIQESQLILALAQVTVSKWSDRKIPFTAIQTLLRISNFLRFRFTQLNSSDHYEVPTASADQLQKSSNMYYDYDGSYSSRMTSKSGPSNPTPTDVLVENFVQLFKSFARALLYTSYDLHIWPVFDSFAFTLLKCVSIFPVDSKILTMNLQGILMELAHIWERKNDFHTTVGICLVSTSVLKAMKLQNETFIVSKDVRNMLRSLLYNPVIRTGWPEIFEYFLQFSPFFDPSAGSGSMSEQPKDSPNGDNPDNHPKKRLLKLLYAVQNASSHDEVFNSVDSIRDVLFPIVYNPRLGNDSLSHILHDIPWRDTFYRFLCVEPRTEGDEDLLSRVLDLFTFILQNVINAGTFKWITPLCCEKSSTTLKLLGSTALKNEMRYGGTAVADLLRSLLDFYEVVLKHGDILATEDTKWELFQIYTAILHSLEQTSYSNFALLTAVTKCFANISGGKSIQAKLKENPIMPMALLHRLTDAVMVLEANGSLLEGFKNNAALYYLSVSIPHMLVPILQDDNFKNFKNDWIERCGRTFHILAVFPDARIKSQAFQMCEILTSSAETKRAFTEKSFKNSMSSLMEMAYSAFIEPNHNASIKFRAGNVIWNIMNDSDGKVRFQLVKVLQHGFPVMIDISRLSSHALWTSRLSLILRNIKPEDKQNEMATSSNAGIPFITPKVLTVLCKILMTFLQSLLIEPSELEGTLHDVSSSGICQMMFRILLNHPLKTETDCRVWLDGCCSMSTVLEALVHLSRLDKTIPTILIGEKKCLSTMFSLLELEIPTSPTGAVQEKLEAALNALCGNILILGTILCCDAGNNFEDLERVAWSQQEVLFKKLTDWLKVTVPVESRKCAINFTHAFLSVLSQRTKSQTPQASDSEQQPTSTHPFLCRNWNENRTYGQILCEHLINILKQAVDNEERMSSMKSLAALFNLSGSSVQYAVEENDIVTFCVRKLQSFGNKFFETKGPGLSGRKSSNTLHMETLCYMQLLSCLFYVSSEAKIAALKNNFPDVLHKIFSWWTSCTDPSLLHAYVEALLNFTEKYPEGALALTLTSNIVGVGPRRVPTQQSIFMEILGILEKELANVESANPNLKTIEIIFELLKNICFVQECRNILLKSPAVLFLRRMHLQETKKWGNKQNLVRANYLDFLVHASAHPDVQNCIAKIPEGLQILIQLAETDNPPCSILALKVLRNLCFNPANRGRLLTENMFMPLLSHKLQLSTDLEEIEHSTVSLWAIIANYEKGKLTAKKAYCVEGISKALERLRKLEQTTNSDKDVPRLISLLETVQNLLGTTNIVTTGTKLVTSSRSSSETQL